MVGNEGYSAAHNLHQEYSMASHKILELRRNGLAAAVIDYDGNIYRRDDEQRYGHSQAIDLFFLIAGSNIPFAIATGRGLTLITEFDSRIPPLVNERQEQLGFYLGCGNGSTLYHVLYGKEGGIHRKLIYQHGMELNDVNWLFENVYLRNSDVERDQGAMEFFANAVDKDWPEDILPKEFATMTRSQGEPGRRPLFIEPIKFSIAPPADRSMWDRYYHEILEYLQNSSYVARRGKEGFIDITKRIIIGGQEIDGKELALRTLLSKENILIDRVATFGDSANDNDARLLRAVKFGFTTDSGADKKKLEEAPYLLQSPDPRYDSPPGAVLDTILYLLP